MKYSSPHTLLMTADTIGGVWTYAVDLCRALQEHDVKVHLATMGESLSRSQRKTINGILNVELHESNFALEWMENPWKDVDEAGDWLLQLERQIQPDIIHLNNYTHGSLPWSAPVLVVGHSCVLSWWEAVKGKEVPVEWNEYQERVRRGLGQADNVVAVSRHFMECLEKFYGPLSNKSIIYNGRYEKPFDAAEKEHLIFSMGRIWDEAKNLKTLKEVANDLSWEVVVAGNNDGNYLSETGNFSLTGQLPQSKIADWLSKSSIYVMPARYEPFGLTILEAALSKCALILGDIPTLREIWGDAAIYINPDNPQQLKDSIEEVIHTPLKLENMARKASERAKIYSLFRMKDQYFKLYQKMLLSYKEKELTA